MGSAFLCCMIFLRLLYLHCSLYDVARRDSALLCFEWGACRCFEYPPWSRRYTWNLWRTFCISLPLSNVIFKLLYTTRLRLLISACVHASMNFLKLLIRTDSLPLCESSNSPHSCLYALVRVHFFFLQSWFPLSGSSILIHSMKLQWMVILASLRFSLKRELMWMV